MLKFKKSKSDTGIGNAPVIEYICLLTDNVRIQMTKKGILFEPWAMGDALIAASILAVRPSEFVLVCQHKWHEIILGAIGGVDNSDLIGIATSYESKNNKARLEYVVDPEAHQFDGSPVYSIRGDVRDYFVAKRIFRKSTVHMSGWVPFIARKIPLFDLPYRYGLLGVKNRYEMWMDLLGMDFGELRRYYADELSKPKNVTGLVGIHIGAQWRSKQFPYVRKLAEAIQERGKSVHILAGQNDTLPDDVAASDVKVVMGKELVAELKNYEFVVTNDSGPMHLAPLLGVRTVAVGAVSNIEFWAPPSVHIVCGDKIPRGYAPISSYWSDGVVEGWPRPEDIAALLQRWKLI